MADRIKTEAASLDGFAPSGDVGISCIGSTYHITENVIWAADHDVGLGPAQVRPVRLSANGTSSQLSTANTTGISGASVDGSTVRISNIADPDDAAKRCWVTRVDSTDADTDGTGAKRCEISIQSPLVFRQGTRYVIGFCQRIADWTSTTDEQLTWQIPPDDSLGVSPWFAHYVAGNARRIDVRFNRSETPSNGTSTITTIWSETDWAPLTWERWVLEITESQSNGYVKAWRNGVVVGEYSGTTGYVQPVGGGSYWKQGVYHWTNAGNTWDASLSMRNVWTKGAFVSDSVTPEDMDALLQTL